MAMLDNFHFHLKAAFTFIFTIPLHQASQCTCDSKYYFHMHWSLWIKFTLTVDNFHLHNGLLSLLQWITFTFTSGCFHFYWYLCHSSELHKTVYLSSQGLHDWPDIWLLWITFIIDNFQFHNG